MKKSHLHILETYQYIFWTIFTMICALVSARGYYMVDPSHIVTLGDFFELSSYDDVQRYSFAFFDHIGQGIPNVLALSNWYYLLLKNLYSVDWIYAHRHFWYIVLYFAWLYISLLCTAKILYARIPTLWYVLALCITFNPLTETFFRYSWWFTHYILQYIWLAVLIFGYVGILESRKNISTLRVCILAIYTGFLLLCTITNVAFLALAAIVCIMLGIGHYIQYREWKNWLYMHVIYGSIVAIAILSIWYYKSILLGENADTIKTSAAYGGDAMNFIRAYSSSLLNTFFFNLNGFGSKTVIYGIFPVLVIILSLIYNKKKPYFILAPFIILLILSVRIHTPFEWINLSIYDSFVGSFIRSADKVFFVYTILLSILVYIVVMYVWKRMQLVLGSILVIFVSFVVYDYPLTYTNIMGKDGPHIQVKIPNEYMSLSGILKTTDRVVALPYHVSISPGWTEHPQWHQRGNTILSELTPAEWISANTADYGGKDSIFRFGVCPTSQRDLHEKLTGFHATYVLIHRDIPANFLPCTRSILDITESDPRYTKIISNSFYVLYNINTLYPYKFKKISPTHYRIYSSSPTQIFDLPYTYSKYWKVIGLEAKSELHDGYATRFILSKPMTSIDVEYTPQSILDFLYLLRITYLVVLLILLTALVASSYRNKS